ncbi:alpha/beta fold hydrolase [Zhihengliuella sp.]|uniref:alpha/beta hydrolase n=1 Tax=Zhihengliuella sp. TaxID=1954483 RepID=UPI002810B4D7|nr:alpha/beta fold hydrolase [Zhihengliuella sp.]
MTSPTPTSPIPPAGSAGRAVLLVHGFTGSPVSLEPWAEDLRGRGYTVSLPLLPGHGTAWQDLVSARWPSWASAVLHAFDELQRNHDRVYVGALSMGGTLALDLATHRRPAALALVNPALSFGDRRARTAGVLRHVVKSTPAIANDIARPGQDEGAYPRTPVAGVAQLGALMKHVRRRLPLVVSPLATFTSDADHVVPPSDSTLIHARVGTPAEHRRATRLPNSYHVATLDYDAETIFAGTAEFFDRY